VNRYSSQGAIAIEQIEKAIRVPVEVQICNAYNECLRAINVGEPVPLNKKSEFSSQLSKWAAILAGSSDGNPPQPARKGFSLWGRKKAD
jgi:septum formation inhibitor-activating ATPase MinD